MKRASDGCAVVSSQMVNLDDLREKIRALTEFAVQACCEKHRDDLLVFLEPADDDDDKTDKSLRNLRLYWYCRKFSEHNKEVKISDDDRDHLALLGKHFKAFDLLITMANNKWIVQVSTPPAAKETNQGTLQVSVPAGTDV